MLSRDSPASAFRTVVWRWRRRREIDMRASYFAIAGAAALLSGCTVGPNYKRPQMPVPASFRAPSSLDGVQAASLADLKWFDVFHDDQLQVLIRSALAHNYDLLDAAARVDA